ncbi:MAG: deoxyribose-phosphate aldolase [Oscillospiraceae bacterium]|jgi:deoxyribose-phosphate aldolase|nr:deoxyribose-phosphate aldolase [Oscillospiraceae bacterium]
MLSASKLAGYLSLNLMRPDSTALMVKEGCSAVASRNLASLCVRPCDVADAERMLKGSGRPVTAAVAFPHGGTDTSVKVAETQKLIDDGAREIIAVLNTGRLLSEKFEYAEQDLKAVTMTALRRGVPVCVAFDSCFLDERMFKIACKIADNIGAQAIMTATGYGSSGTRAAEIARIKEMLGSRMKCVANGGIRTLDQVNEMIAAGADRVVTAFAAQIMDEAAGRAAAQL